MSEKKTFQYGNTTIHYKLSYAERNQLAINVHPDTSVTVEAPLGSDFAAIEKRIHKRAAWILKQQRNFRRYSFEIPPRQYVSGESHRYLGRQYRLHVIADNVPLEFVRMDRGIMTLFSNSKSPKRVEKVLNDFYRERARKIFKEQVAKWYPHFEKYDVPYPQVVIRKMKSRWGSCTANGKITLNLKLIHVPKKLIDYVIVHELAHLVEHNHAPAFYALLSKIMPDWEKRKEKLNGFEF